MPAPGLLIAAPASGSGKTTLTLALLRHLRDAGRAVASVKVGPDFIDPVFHAVASGRPCLNIDGWAMRPETVAALVGQSATGSDLVIGEGVMGLFDGAPDGTGSTADLSALTGWPVVLVIDVRGQAASAAATLSGFAGHREDVTVAGVVFNRVGGDRHRRVLEQSCRNLGIPILGFVPRDPTLALPDRHLGLVQACEHEDLEGFLASAADRVAASVDVPALIALAGGRRMVGQEIGEMLPPPGQRVALAQDTAFAFTYPAVLEGWRRAGAEVIPFSPLADQAPDPRSDAVFLPGGYPELHAGRLAGNGRFLAGLREAADRSAVIYGECGGYMVLGRTLVDADAVRHNMAGLLPLESAFDRPRLSLGYRDLALASEGPLGRVGRRYRGHEFHYATASAPSGVAPLFASRDACGTDLGAAGLQVGSVMGSFVHLIDHW